jgi:hypothetical protein
MSMLENDINTVLAFSVFENRGVFALLLGSGLSRAAEIPTGWEITIDLIRRIGAVQGVEGQTDWGDWYRKEHGAEPSYSTLLEQLGLSPDERRSILHNYIQPSEEDREQGRKVPTRAHFAIAELVRSGYIRVIITTNFDRLMENALRERGVEPTIISSIDALKGAEPMTHSACYLLKLHGDYKDARILNTDAELGAYPKEMDAVLDRVFDEYGLIVAGWSGDWDHALRAAFLRAVNRRYSVFWAVRSKISDAAQILVEHRRARMVQIANADAFFVGLQQRVEALSHSRRQNASSIDLLVSSTKRYLAKPEYRIQLDDLVNEQTQGLAARMDGNEFSPDGAWSESEFRTRLGLYEAASEPLVRMAGILGRWGTGSELPLMLHTIGELCTHATKVRSGQAIWVELRAYPAVLVMTAYGLGLTRAQRWSDLHRLFYATMVRENGDSRLVDSLFLWGWSGDSDDYWRQLPGLERHHTPLSDHLCALFAAWAPSFTGVMGDFELLFERYEMLASLACLEAMPEAELQATLAEPGNAGCVWMPVGRMGWDRARRVRLFGEMAVTEAIEPVLAAGFGLKRRPFIDLFMKNVERVSVRMRWY